MPRAEPAPARGLPGADIVERGISDLEAGRETVSAMAVSMAGTRLRAAGVHVPRTPVDRPSHRLYELLASEDPRSAHGRYNAIVGRMASFARALEHARAR